jgi:hypothetical protein
MVLDILSYKDSLAAKYGKLFSDVWLQFFIDYWYVEDNEVINQIKFNPLKNYGT